jgi:hypothetical protein
VIIKYKSILLDFTKWGADISSTMTQNLATTCLPALSDPRNQRNRQGNISTDMKNH